MSDLHERIEGAIETLGSTQHCLTCRNTQVSKPPDGRLVVWCTEKKWKERRTLKALLAGNAQEIKQGRDCPAWRE